MITSRIRRTNHGGTEDTEGRIFPKATIEYIECPLVTVDGNWWEGPGARESRESCEWADSFNGR